MSDTTEWPTFTGDPTVDKIQPSEFIRRFNLKTIGDAATRLEAFSLCLGPVDSVASAWYDDLSDDVKASHNDTTRAFLLRFKDIVKAQQTAEEYQRELFQLELPESRIGRKETSQGVETWTHIVFADRILYLAQKGGIATSAAQIWQVRDKLPRALKEKVGATQTDWNTFAKALRDVSADDLRDIAREFDEKAASEKKQNERIAALEANLRNARQATSVESPTAPLRMGMRNARIRDESPTRSTPRDAPLRRTTTDRTPQSSSQPRGPPRPLSKEQRSTLEQNVHQLTLHPDTVAGRTLYQQQVRAWVSAHGEQAWPAYNKPFPLKPGTSRVCTNECYTCGIADNHIWEECSNPPITETERRWRRYCGFHLGRMFNTKPIQVNLVAEFPFLAEDTSDDQGKD